MECTLNADNCQSCLNIPGVRFTGSTCVCDIPGFFVYYDNLNNKNECLPCNPICQTCYGPANTQCYTCVSAIGVAFSLPSTCSCSSHFYFDINLGNCATCNSLCQNCTGPLETQCIECNSSISLSVIDQPGSCVFSCDQLVSYYQQGTYCNSIFYSI